MMPPTHLVVDLGSELLWMVQHATPIGSGLAVVVLLYRVAKGLLSGRHSYRRNRVPLPAHSSGEILGEIPVFVWALEMTQFNSHILSGHVWINPGLLTVHLYDVLAAYLILPAILLADLFGRAILSRPEPPHGMYRIQFGTVVAAFLPLFDCASAVGPLFFNIGTGGR
jgi:hypothetical protein